MKFGDKREDGFIWVGHHWRGGKQYDHWLSPEAFNKKRMNSQKRTQAIFRKRYTTDPEFKAVYKKKMCDYQRVMREEYPALSLFRKARSRARLSGIPFTIQPSDVVIPKRCPVFGFPLKYKHPDYTPSLDRIINKLGYVPGNVRVISFRANRLKMDSTLGELKKLVKYMEL